jgi:hypothetical protein
MSGHGKEYLRMASALARLIELLPPPSTPHATSVDWARVEENLRLKLPDDYKAFTETYGSVTICSELAVLHPMGLDGDWRSDSIRLLADTIDPVVGGRDQLRYPNYPAPGGIFPIMQIFGNLVCWVTAGPSNDWRILYWATWGTEVDEFPMTFTEFLVEVVARRTEWFCDQFPDTWFGMDSEDRHAKPYIPAPRIEYDE